MRRIATLAALVLALPSAAHAEVARVTSGEHPEFTRIVITAEALGDWRFGRTADGYELEAASGVSGYDLTAAFDRIPRDRVSGLWRDPDSGRLRIALSCPCHAIAFAFRSGTVVVDVKTGRPPKGSAFEESLDLATTPLLPPGAPRKQHYDWLALWLGREKPAPSVTDPIFKKDFSALRDALLREISQGVAEGLVEVAGNPIRPEHISEEVISGLRISLGDLPGVITTTPGTPAPALSAQGASCLGDDALNLGAWLGTPPLAQLLSQRRAGLLGEFDNPNRNAVLQSVRLQLALGFGAEARQVLALLEEDSSDEVVQLRAMSFAVDLDPAPSSPFAGMEGCDSAAALWAALADPWRAALPDLNGAALARSFSALPATLRPHLGPPLAELALRSGQPETARRIRDAILRLPKAPSEAKALEATYLLATEDPAAAADLAESNLAEGGAGALQTALTLTEAAFRSDRSVPPHLPQDLAAFLPDARGTPQERPLRRAYILALAMTGDHAAAFEAVENLPEARPDLWALSAKGADDSLFLTQAIRAVSPPAGLDPEVAHSIAARLLALGFPEQVALWLPDATRTSEPSVRRLMAQATLALRDARAVIGWLAGLEDPEAEALRGKALLQLGDAQVAAAAFDRAGDQIARDAALRLIGQWQGDGAEAGPWTSAAALIPTTPPEALPPLARGHALSDAAAEVRVTLTALLDGLPTQ